MFTFILIFDPIVETFSSGPNPQVIRADRFYDAFNVFGLASFWGVDVIPQLRGMTFTAQKMKFSIEDFFNNLGFGHIYWRNP